MLNLLKPPINSCCYLLEVFDVQNWVINSKQDVQLMIITRIG